MEQRSCPNCGHHFIPQVYISIILPPTGGDYEWIDGTADLQCPQCGEYLNIRVRQYLEGGHPSELGPLKLADHPDWRASWLLWSPDGRRLAIGIRSSVRVYEHQAQPQWSQIFQTEGQLVDLDDEQVVIALPSRSLARRCEGWDVTTGRKMWEIDLDSWNETNAIAVDHVQRFLVRGGLPQVLPKMQHLEMHKFEGGETFRTPVSDQLDTGTGSKVYFNLARQQALCLRSELNAPHNSLDLWQLDETAHHFSKVADYSLPRSQFAWATWEPDGNILVVEIHNHDGLVFYNQMPYGLVRLESKTLAVLQQSRQVAPTACPHMTYLTHVQYLSSGEIAWGTDCIHLLDGQTWEYRTKLPCSLNKYDTLAITPDGQTIAIGRVNDVEIFDRAANQTWSLRKARFL